MGALFFATSCSQLNIILRWADLVVAEYADGYFDLSSGQKKLVKQAVNRFIEEGRRAEFIQISATLNHFADEIEASNGEGLKRDRIDFYKKKAEDHVQVFFKSLAPFVTQLSLSVGSEQWKYYLKETKDEIEKARQKHSDEKEDRENRKERIQENFEFWIDDLTSIQEKIIEEFVSSTSYNWELSWKNKMDLANRLANEKLTAKERQNLIEKITSNLDFAREPEFIKSRKQYQDKLYEISVQILQTLSSSQKKHLIKQLRKQAKAFRGEAS